MCVVSVMIVVSIGFMCVLCACDFVLLCVSYVFELCGLYVLCRWCLFALCMCVCVCVCSVCGF